MLNLSSSRAFSNLTRKDFFSFVICWLALNQNEEFRKILPEALEKQLDVLQTMLDEASDEAIRRVCRSEDEVSKGLEPLFAGPSPLPTTS